MKSPLPLSATFSLAVLWAAIAVPADSQEIQFQRRPTRVHDVSKQTIQCDLKADRIIRQQKQLVDQAEQQLQRYQERIVTILAVENHRPQRARIDYLQMSTKAQASGEPAVQVTHPVAHRSYFVELRNNQLLLRNQEGEPPTPEEEQILRLHLATFGKPNPLAIFLDGKRLRVGSSLVVPKEVSAELLGLTGNDGETEELVLHLVGVQQSEGRDVGLFDTVLRTSNPDASLTLLMRGQLAIEVDTCRTRSISLEGPVAMSEARGPAQGRFMVSTNGTLRVSVTASMDP